MPLARHTKIGEVALTETATSVGASPTTVYFVSPTAGHVVWAALLSVGNLTGTGLLTVTNLSATGTPSASIALAATTGPAVSGFGEMRLPVNEGDLLSVVSSGVGGAAIAGKYAIDIKG